jgi:hypothetical protein
MAFLTESPEGKELLRLSLECYHSLTLKYPLRGHWTPEFQPWRAFLEATSGEDLSAFDREAVDRSFIRMAAKGPGETGG